MISLTSTAEAAYKLATSFTPNDPAPISNLSAVGFELGHYGEAGELAVKALSLSVDADEAWKQKILSRIVRSFVHVQNYEGALSAAQRMVESQERESLISHLRFLLDLSQKGIDAVALRKSIVMSLPRYRPCL